MKTIYYIDDTDVETDNHDLTTTTLHYKDQPDVEFSVDIRFALWLVENALENAYAYDIPVPLRTAVNTLQVTFGLREKL